ncbi:DUF4097 family beta strand repeat-containing protein [Planococcus alpniumensis]|uniref:DUF4097 family beta strand repeat-containing protein n=1 Tax=Planococcus alpniumensis TaxID=2708345 RepID=UPI001B8C8715|nr:DUF4097 family beta strand repeat-containing protein [Planococcus sp. MSAK28401]
MTENQFLQELETALKQLPKEEQNDILQDIKEYFANGQADGKTDNEIADELGSPQEIADELIESFDFNQNDISTAANELTEDKFDQVDIQIDNGMLTIGPSEDGKMYADITDKSYRQQLSVDILNRTLVITLKEEPRKWGIFSFTGSMKSPKLDVRLPKKLYDKILIDSDHGMITGENLDSRYLSIETDNGRIELTQMNADQASVKSDNGDIELARVQAKKLKVGTDNGQLQLRNIQADELDASTDNGAIDLRDIEGNVRAKTDNGLIHLSTVDLDRTISLEADNGAISVETRVKPTNATIRANVDWGTVSVFGVKNRHSVFGSGENAVDLQSDNGSIKVELV